MGISGFYTSELTSLSYRATEAEKKHNFAERKKKSQFFSAVVKNNNVEQKKITVLCLNKYILPLIRSFIFF